MQKARYNVRSLYVDRPRFAFIFDYDWRGLIYFAPKVAVELAIVLDCFYFLVTNSEMNMWNYAGII